MADNDASTQQPERTWRVLLYSHDAGTRQQVRTAVGRRPASDVGRVEFVECATAAVAVTHMDDGDVDLAILDGEAQPTGGMGLCRQLKDEIYRCPPVLVLIARRDDRWLANWSRADAVAEHPVDPVTLPEPLADLMRRPLSLPAT